MQFQITPTGSALGAEICGFDFGQDLCDGEIERIRTAWLEHSVVFFRGQAIGDEELVHFSRQIGDLELGPASEISRAGGNPAPKLPEIWVISNVIENGVPIGSLGSGEAEWHTDMSYVDRPPIASVLHAREIPDVGADTSFANMYEALARLPPDLLERIKGRFANHDSSYTRAGALRVGATPVVDITRAPGARHPLILCHPESGRDALFLGRRTNGYILGLPVEESEELLDLLWAECTRDEIVYRHQWRVGDVLMWDNRCVIHRRDEFDPGSRRIMHRTQINARNLRD